MFSGCAIQIFPNVPFMFSGCAIQIFPNVPFIDCFRLISL